MNGAARLVSGRALPMTSRYDDVASLAPRLSEAGFHERNGRLGRNLQRRGRETDVTELSHERLGTSAAAFDHERPRAHR